MKQNSFEFYVYELSSGVYGLFASSAHFRQKIKECVMRHSSALEGGSTCKWFSVSVLLRSFENASSGSYEERLVMQALRWILSLNEKGSKNLMVSVLEAKMLQNIQLLQEHVMGSVSERQSIGGKQMSFTPDRFERLEWEQKIRYQSEQDIAKALGHMSALEDQKNEELQVCVRELMHLHCRVQQDQELLV